MNKKDYKTPSLTVDCIIENEKGEILLVKRKNPPHGWALPGGFVDYGESVESAVVREVFEETGLKIYDVEQLHVYSDPERDPRCHAVSVVFCAVTKGTPRAGDDAKEAKFFNIHKLPEEIAFDHRKIIKDFREGI